MFCFQCEQTMKGTGCTAFGVCGKPPEVADLQDLLVHLTKGISVFNHLNRKKGQRDKDTDHFILEALFTTITNVNFSVERMKEVILRGKDIREKAKSEYLTLYNKSEDDIMNFPECTKTVIPSDRDKLIDLGEKISVENRMDKRGENIVKLEELVTYGLKGMAAYADHAYILGEEDNDVYDFFAEALNSLAYADSSEEELVNLVLQTGKVNLRVMELLDRGNTQVYGHPEPTKVRITPVKGKAILVSGHDLKDLELLLKQTEGRNINVYTHGEMLPCHAYPQLKKYDHLVGNYGGAWQDQRKEFDAFPGAILMTTNCIQKPKASYQKRIFTTGLVAWEDVVHIGKDKDFSPVIDAALSSEGFSEDDEEKYITVGFGHNAVMKVSNKVINAVKSGDIRHFFLIGGCDGAKPGRNYYTEFAENVPDDCVILTLACGKYRFNKLEFGDIGGIPRLLDAGQCNDAFSAIQIALALSKAFDTDVNSLPLSFILSWYEQKAVCILLTLLYLGIKNMRLGPSLPAFVSPQLLSILQDKFNITPISSAKEDLNAILN